MTALTLEISNWEPGTKPLEQIEFGFPTYDQAKIVTLTMTLTRWRSMGSPKEIMVTGVVLDD